MCIACRRSPWKRNMKLHEMSVFSLPLPVTSFIPQIYVDVVHCNTKHVSHCILFCCTIQVSTNRLRQAGVYVYVQCY